MSALRRLLMNHRAGMAWAIALVLAMKLLVPAGFMPVLAGGTITIEICTGTGPATMTMAMPGIGQGNDAGGHAADHPAKTMPCAFSGLASPAVAAADALLLAVVIAFVMAVLLRPARPFPTEAAPRLRPPPRGPPAHI